MKIIGLSGTNGSGKDTVGHLLAEEYGYLFISGSDMLRREADKRGLAHERENLRAIGNEWRKAHGAGVLVIKAKELAAQHGQDFAIASLRNPGEVDEVHKQGGIVVWVDADPSVRYSRISSGSRARTEDDKTYEQFIAEEEAEMHQTGDSSTLNMSAVKEKADIFLENSGQDIEHFKVEAAQKLKIYL